MIFRGKDIVHRRRGMNCRKAADRAFGHMDGHGNTVFIGHVGDFFQLQRAAAGEDVRMDDGDPPDFDKRLEPLFQVNVFAGADGNCGGRAKTLILLGVHPRHHVFHPGKIVFFHSPVSRMSFTYCSR